MPNCLNCHQYFEGKFCNHCGQKCYTEKDKSLKSILNEALHFFTHLEGKFFTTLKTILFHPGKMSSDYSRGIRQKYYKPISFYLLCVLLYLVFPMFSGLNMEMKFYEVNPLYGELAAKQIVQKMATTGLSREALAETFHRKSESTAKVLLLLLIPFTAAIIYLISFKSKRWMFDNFILATEINSFYIILFYFIFPPVVIGINYLRPSTVSEGMASLAIILTYVVYVFFLLRRSLQLKKFPLLLATIKLVLLHTFTIQFIYKFIVFECTMLFIQ